MSQIDLAKVKRGEKKDPFVQQTPTLPGRIPGTDDTKHQIYTFTTFKSLQSTVREGYRFVLVLSPCFISVIL